MAAVSGAHAPLFCLRHGAVWAAAPVPLCSWTPQLFSCSSTGTRQPWRQKNKSKIQLHGPVFSVLARMSAVSGLVVGLGSPHFFGAGQVVRACKPGEKEWPTPGETPLALPGPTGPGLACTIAIPCQRWDLAVHYRVKCRCQGFKAGLRGTPASELHGIEC